MYSCRVRVSDSAKEVELRDTDKGHLLEKSATEMRHKYAPVIGAAILGVALVVALFAWEGWHGFSLMDEGYLWYGIQRVMVGEVPFRDFQSYDPGRYYFSALLMQLAGAHGIVAVRITLAILQALSLSAVLGWLMVTCAKRQNGYYVFVCAVILATWMVPRHKLYDISISMGLVCMLACLIRRPSRTHYFATGLLVGLAAYFGKNHGAYGLVASCGVFLYQAVRCDSWTDWWRGIAIFGVGVIVGFLPMIAMMIFVHGFTSAFIDSIKFFLDIKATNLPLPVPWPWLAPFGTMPMVDALRVMLIGVFFVGIILFPGMMVCHVVLARLKERSVQPLLVACAFCAIPYAHYAFSRADLPHLAQGTFPALIGVLVLAMSMQVAARVLMAVMLCTISMFMTAPLHPGWQCVKHGACERVVMGNDTLRVDNATAQDIALLRELDKRYAAAGQQFFVAPFMPGAYALLGTKSPTWEIYTGWARSDTFEQSEIERIKSSRPAFVLIYDFPLDGRDALRYRNTHPLIEQYIHANYACVNGFTDNPAYQIYRPKGS